MFVAGSGRVNAAGLPTRGQAPGARVLPLIFHPCPLYQHNDSFFSIASIHFLA
jgi:hypothetical protein